MIARVIGSLFLAMTLSLGVTGCGDDANRLYGSVSEVYPLDFDKVGVSLQGNFLVIEYTKASTATSAGKVAKLSVLTDGLMVKPGQAIDLTEMVGTASRGTLQRVLESTVELTMMRGTLTLDGFPTAGKQLSGHFATTLSNPSGRTLNGDFQATVLQQ